MDSVKHHFVSLLLTITVFFLPGTAIRAEYTAPIKTFELDSDQVGSSGFLGMTATEDFAYLLYHAGDGVVGLWKNDGTSDGTELVRNFAYNDLMWPYGGEMVAWGDLVFFAADDGIHGLEIWRSDGTEEGTFMLADMFPGEGMVSNTFYRGGILPGPPRMTPMGEHLYLLIDGWTFVPEKQDRFGLWRTDGTSEGTILIRDHGSGGPGQFWQGYVTDRTRVLGDQLYFWAADFTYGFELWKSDGTPEGTSVLKDICPGAQSSLRIWELEIGQEMGILDGSLYFLAHDGIYGHELWKTDGTESGTVMVKDIHVGAGGSNPEGFGLLGNALYFLADDGVHGRELWKTDGTALGTTLVKDIHASGGLRDAVDFESFGDFLYFNADDGIHGQEIWRTNGTSQGTTLLKDIWPGAGHPYLGFFNGYTYTKRIFFRAPDGLYFGAQGSGDTRGIWKTGGTSASTVFLPFFIAPNTPFPSLTIPRYIVGRAEDILFDGASLFPNDDTGGPALLKVLKDGEPFPMPEPTPIPTPTPTPTPTPIPTPIPTPPPDPTPTPTPTSETRGRLVNISTRAHVGTADEVMIAGFIIEGGPASVLLRGRGPSLEDAGVTNVLADPQIRLFSGENPIAYNDDWMTSQGEAIDLTGFSLQREAESAILIELEEGPYTAILSGFGGITGIGIAEGFGLADSEEESPARVINISTRGRVGTGNEVMIGGFIIEGGGAQVLLRARGPSLGDAGVPDVLNNPRIRLFSGTTQIDFNDDWESGQKAAEIELSGLAPSDSREAALLRSLSPGAYTLIVEGTGGSAGNAIVEIFDVTEQ